MRAGRTLGDLDLQIPLSVEFTDNVEEAGKRHARGYGFTFGAMGSLRNNFYKNAFARQGYEEDVNEVQRLWMAREREAARDRVPIELAMKANLIGTPAMIADRLGVYRDAGITTLRVGLAGADASEKLDTLARVDGTGGGDGVSCREAGALRMRLDACGVAFLGRYWRGSLTDRVAGGVVRPTQPRLSRLGLRPPLRALGLYRPAPRQPRGRDVPSALRLPFHRVEVTARPSTGLLAVGHRSPRADRVLNISLCPRIPPSGDCRVSIGSYSPFTSRIPLRAIPYRSPPVGSNSQYSNTPMLA